MSKQRFIIIDGNALLHRAWHALPPLTTQKGELVNAVYGFLMIFLKMFKELKPDYVAVTFDRREPTFRHKEFKEYKAHREKQPDELYNQIPRLKEVIETFGVPIYEKAGYEADDVIGAICENKTVNSPEIDSIIVTGDLDTLQLVDDNTKVYTLKRGITDTVIYDEKAVKQRYGLTPGQLIDFKALKGDPSDNIPGVKGIGEKTALEMIKEFGSLENLYNNYKKSKQIKERYKKLLQEQKEKAFLSKRLVTIIRDIPDLKFDLEKCRFGQYDQNKIIKLFQELEFKTLLNKLPLAGEEARLEQGSLSFGSTPPTAQPKKKLNYQLIDTEERLKEFISKLKKQKEFALDTETTGLDTFQAKLLGISFSWKEGEAYYVSNKGLSLLLKDSPLSPILKNSETKKIGHNIKFDVEVLATAGINLQGIYFDTMIAAYLLNPGSRTNKLDTLAFREFGHQMIPITDLIGKGKDQISMAEVPIEKVADYSCEDVDYTWRLYQNLKADLKEKGLEKLFRNIEMPLLPVLQEMETNGVKIDALFLKNLSKKVGRQIDDLERKIHKLAGVKFNVNSPLQLKEILFEKLKISTQGLGRTKTGISSAAAELEKMRGRHPIIDLISEHRELAKLKSTYLDALPRLINPKTGRVHTSFNQTITATGRLSSSEPNLQNIPVRTDLGREIRKAFIAEKGYKILAADYSQIELRVIASLANDQKMIKAFREGQDIHTATAAEIWNVSPDKVTPKMRRDAKTINFGVTYGMGARGLAQAAGISQEEARGFIERYFTLYEGVNEYIIQTKELAQELGYVETLFGRRRYLPDLYSGVQQIQAAAERMAVNMPIQGTSADLLKMAMIKIHENIETKEQKNKNIRMLLQVHDELVFEVKDDFVKEAAKMIQEEMETAAKLKVPLVADISVGNSWGELKKLF